MIFITVIFTCALCAVIPAAPEKTANAESAEISDTYAVAAQHDVWFYSEPNGDKGLFILPFSYYVKVLKVSRPFCEVEYLEDAVGYEKVTGYCRYDDLQFVDFVPKRPYLHLNLTLVYSLNDTEGIEGTSLSTYERPVTFYGTYYNGTALKYYVYVDKQFAKVSPSDVKEDVKYDYNTDYLTPTSAGTDDGKPSSSGEGLSGVQIAVICIVCAAAVAVAFFVLRGKKPPVSQGEEHPEF